MSQENVEIVREAFIATSGGDAAAALWAWDPAIEWDMSGVTGWPEKRVYRGEEVGEFLRMWDESWQEWHFDLDEVRDGTEERVFAAIHEWGIGAATRANVEQRRYFATTLRGGRFVRVQMFSERPDALEAAGLEE